MISPPRSPLIIARLDLPENWRETLAEYDFPAEEGLAIDFDTADARRLDIPEVIEDTPDLLAMVSTFSGAGAFWLVFGPAAIVAAVPISQDTAEGRDQALRAWADTITSDGALGLIATAHGELGWDDETGESETDGHFLAALPLSGISTHRGRNVDEEKWCDDLAAAVVTAAWDEFELDLSAMAVVSQASGEPTLMWHIMVYDADPELVETQVRQSLLTALRPLTPRGRVEERLNVRAATHPVGDG